MPIKRLQIDNLHPANPLNEVVTNINENLDAIIEIVDNLNNGVPVMGEVGPRGDQGPEGRLGPPGPQGDRGEKGDKGDQGEPGKDGKDGRDGIDGKDGKDGAPGEQGPAGKDGRDGQDGQPGRDGLPGVDGKDGKDGIPGRDGIDGKDGIQGPLGPKGDKGDQGIQGIPGRDGKDGINGKDGAPGAQGIPGTAGKDGAPGATGAKGDQGLKGDKGDPGAQGIQGLPGKDGTNGKDGNAGSISAKTYSPASVVNNITTPGQVILSTTFTTIGNPVFIMVTGDANPVVPGWIRLQLYRNGAPIGKITQAEAVNANVNVPYCVHALDTPPAGTYTYSMQMQAGAGGTWQFGEADPPTMTIMELVGAVVPATTTAPATSSPPVVGSAPNPMAPIVVTSPQGYKAANLDDGVELTLDTLGVTLNTAAPRSLLMRVTSGTMSVRISGEIYWTNNGNGNYGANYWGGNTLTTTNQQIFAWDFPWAGDKATYHIQDLTNRRLYRVTLIIGASYKKNYIVMERLV